MIDRCEVASNDEAFRYNALAADHIRILHLAPGQPGDPFIGTLDIAKLEDSCGRYEALSYTWGDPSRVTTILVNNRVLKIAKNLSTALNHLRHPEEILIVWIDAICINQDDQSERAMQVQFMHQIYSNAKIVRSWINEPDINASDLSFTLLRNFEIDITKDDNLFNPGDDVTKWDALMPLLENEYWSRIWIQQEVWSARNWTVQCPGLIVPGQALRDFYLASLHTSGSVRMGWYAAIPSTERRILASVLRNPTLSNMNTLNTKLLSILLKVPELRSSDARDRIYGLMHVASDHGHDSLKVDYSKPVFDIMLDAVIHHLRLNRDVEFLAHAGTWYQCRTRPSSEENQHMPSWMCPSWFGLPRKILNLKSVTNIYWGSRQPESVIIDKWNLRIRAVKVDQTEQLLSKECGDVGLTVQQFKDSSFGTVLRTLFDLGIDSAYATIYGLGIDREEDVMNCAQMLDSLFASCEEEGHLPLEQAWELYLPANLPDRSRSRMSTLLHRKLIRADIFITRSNILGRIPSCDFRSGDEVWIVLGCEFPLILRPQSNGAYQYICPAEIFLYYVTEELKRFTEESQPGDRIGENVCRNWIVEDIELE